MLKVNAPAVNTFYKFMIPTGGKQQFEYIYFPGHLYCPSENGIPCPPEFFDPYYYWYVYKDGEFIFQEDFTHSRRD